MAFFQVRDIAAANVQFDAHFNESLGLPIRRDQHFATVCFNGMLNPVIPYAIRGALWYQGESICWGTRDLNLYGQVQKTMIRDWRSRWGEGDFPFYLVQLPGQVRPTCSKATRSLSGDSIDSGGRCTSWSN